MLCVKIGLFSIFTQHSNLHKSLSLNTYIHTHHGSEIIVYFKKEKRKTDRSLYNLINLTFIFLPTIKVVSTRKFQTSHPVSFSFFIFIPIFEKKYVIRILYYIEKNPLKTHCINNCLCAIISVRWWQDGDGCYTYLTIWLIYHVQCVC